VARTFQVPREFPRLSVRDNLAVAAPRQIGDGLLRVFLSPGKVRAQQDAIRADVDSLIAFLNLKRVADDPAGSLSGGQKKLLELGRALMLKPRLLLLDEPFAGVNPVLVEEICDRIRELRDRGIGLLIVEHNLPALSHLASHVYVMDQGRVIASGDPKGALQDPRVRLAYVGAAA
jgi:branched-chain amino acid transport system ATP-binding protein